MRTPMSRRGRRALLAAASAAALVTALAAPASAATAPVGVDPFTQATCRANNTTNHQANVEPDSFSNGSTIVAAYQVGRIFDGGACAIGFSTSTDNGANWVQGLLPGITKFSPGGSTNDRATDASVAYDAKHNAWLVSSLTLVELPTVHGNAVVTSRSLDGGLTWSGPVVTATGADLDKNWIVCDNTATSPNYGNCYTEWDDHGNGNRMQMNRSRDGGLTWSAPATNGSGIIGGQPVVQPSGVVVVPTANANETAIGAYRSTDGGLTWGATQTLATVQHHTVAGSLREGPLPSAEVAGDGTVYVAWADCRFRRACRTNDIVYVRSTNAGATTWSAVTRVPIDATGSGIDHFIPGLAVNKATSGATTQLGLTYYFYASGSSSLQVGSISSSNGGSTWSAPQTVSTLPAPSTWAANTTQGRMVGDYISTSFGSDNLAHGIFGLATTPTSGASTACTTSALDNCRVSIATSSTGLAAGAAASATGPVLFTGNGGTGAQNLWNIVDNNGIQHRD